MHIEGLFYQRNKKKVVLNQIGKISIGAITGPVRQPLPSSLHPDPISNFQRVFLVPYY